MDKEGTDMGTAILIGIGVVAGIVLLYLCYCGIETSQRRKKMYAQGMAEMNKGNYGGALISFEPLAKFHYRDSARLAEACRANRPKQTFNEGVGFMEQGDYSTAISFFSSTSLADDPQAQEMLERCREALHAQAEAKGEQIYQQGLRQMREGRYGEAEKTFGSLMVWRSEGAKTWCYRDSDVQLAECRRLLQQARLKDEYESGRRFLEKGDLLAAKQCFDRLPDGYSGKATFGKQLYDALYSKGVECYERGKDAPYAEQKGWHFKAKNYLEALPRDYRDAGDCLRRACQTLYGLDFCGDSPSYQHVWEELEHIVDVDNELRKIGHGVRRCRCCGKVEDFSYDYDTDGY